MVSASPKYIFWGISTLFSPYFISTPTSLCNKNTQKPLYFLRFKALAFFLIKTGNYQILYIFISFLVNFIYDNS